MRWIPVLLVAAACDTRMAEDPNGWWGDVGAFDEDVTEPIEFTEEPYDFDGPGIGALKQAVRTNARVYSPMASPSGTCDDWSTSNDLPIETWAMVTLHPRYYYKTQGCDRGSDEKYYGNYFVEDASGGIFVLNDSKVAHYEMGDRVRIRVNALAEAFDLPRVMSHEIVEVERGPFPIHYTWAGRTTGTGDDIAYDDPSTVGRVVRAEGVVLNEPDTFGQFEILDDEGHRHLVNLDAELNRRKVRPPVGSRIQVTGPVLDAFGQKIVVMRIGQITMLEPAQID